MAYNGNIGTESLLTRQVIGGDDPLQSYEKQLKKQIELNTRYGKLSAEEISKYQEKLDKERLKKEKKEYKEFMQEVHKANQNIFQKMAQGAFDTLSKFTSKVSSSIDSYIQKYTQYMGSINTRLQGTSLSFDKLARNIATNLGTSPYIRQEEMLTNLNKFVEQGIAYNLESRAFLATATAKIANTFNSFDSSLLRIIKIQQADSTVARIGMESLLTKFLNARYEDTSYLTNTANIRSNLLEAESIMGYKGATEFEYAVQRYLGSMSSLGVSDAAINMISQGLGYLGSGNYSALLGNEGLRNLFGMAASRAGTDLGSLLSGGLTASSASSLLSNIIGIGQNIATSGNNVTRSAFANLFGFSLSDVISLTNITAEDLREITKNIVSYEKLRNETTNQLNTISQRTTTSEKVQNVISNIMTGLGANIATSPALYGVWEAANLLAGSGLDYKFGVGVQTSLSQVMKTGVVGISGITSIVRALGNLNNLGGTSLSAWGERETRGKGGLGEYVSGKSISGTSYIGSLDSSSLGGTLGDIKDETKTYTDSSSSDDVDKILKDNISPNVANILSILESWDTSLKSSNLSRLLGIY